MHSVVMRPRTCDKGVCHLIVALMKALASLVSLAFGKARASTSDLVLVKLKCGCVLAKPKSSRAFSVRFHTFTSPTSSKTPLNTVTGPLHPSPSSKILVTIQKKLKNISGKPHIIPSSGKSFEPCSWARIKENCTCFFSAFKQHV